MGFRPSIQTHEQKSVTIETAEKNYPVRFYLEVFDIAEHQEIALYGLVHKKTLH